MKFLMTLLFVSVALFVIGFRMGSGQVMGIGMGFTMVVLFETIRRVTQTNRKDPNGGNPTQPKSGNNDPSGIRKTLERIAKEESERDTFINLQRTRLQRGQKVMFTNSDSGEIVGIVARVNKNKGKVEVEAMGRLYYPRLKEIQVIV